MNYRSVKIHAAEALGTSGTKIIPINVKDPITSLMIQGNISVGAAPRLAPPVDALTKVAIVDGSDVIFELSGSEVIAHGFYEGQKLIPYAELNYPDIDTGFALEFFFGRYKFDPLLAFDPTKFSNPMLRITWDVSVCNDAATAIELEVDAECFDEKIISPVGFLRTTEHHSYTGVDDTYHYIDLPTDLVIRKLYLQTKDYCEPPGYALTDVKLQEDNDKRVVFEMDRTTWANKIARDFGYMLQNAWVYATGYPDGRCYPAPGEAVMAIGSQQADYRDFMVNRSRGCCISVISADTTDTVQLIVTGTIPFYVWCYPFGLQQEIDDWYDVTRVGSLRLRVKAGSDGSDTTYNTILQQLRRY